MGEKVEKAINKFDAKESAIISLLKQSIDKSEEAIQRSNALIDALASYKDVLTTTGRYLIILCVYFILI